jgi:hypothetical protein
MGNRLNWIIVHSFYFLVRCCIHQSCSKHSSSFTVWRCRDYAHAGTVRVLAIGCLRLPNHILQWGQRLLLNARTTYFRCSLLYGVELMNFTQRCVFVVTNDWRPTAQQSSFNSHLSYFSLTDAFTVSVSLFSDENTLHWVRIDLEDLMALTPCRGILKKLIVGLGCCAPMIESEHLWNVSQFVRDCAAQHPRRQPSSLTAVFTRVRQWTVSWVICTQSIPSRPSSLRSRLMRLVLIMSAFVFRGFTHYHQETEYPMRCQAGSCHVGPQSCTRGFTAPHFDFAGYKLRSFVVYRSEGPRTFLYVSRFNFFILGVSQEHSLYV